MKSNYIKLVSIFLISLSISPVFSTNTTLTLPIENFILIPKNILTFGYEFGDFPIIFCYDNNSSQNTGIITWPFQKNLKQSSLPITLVISSEWTGSLADPKGIISINNNTLNIMVVSCYFAF